MTAKDAGPPNGVHEVRVYGRLAQETQEDQEPNILVEKTKHIDIQYISCPPELRQSMTSDTSHT